jgi:hypothetical protein
MESSKMAHDIARGDKRRRPLYGSGPSPVGYRFGRGHLKGGPGRSALNRVSDWSKRLVAAIADAKLRRMQRELELRGIRFDQPDEAWIASSLRDRGRDK